MTAYQYAKDTTVSAGQSRDELERMLERVGADAVGIMRDGREAKVAFRLGGRHYVVNLTLPGDGEVRPGRRPLEKRREQAHKERWRALVLLVKAKIIAVETGITTPEAEFLAHAMLPNGQTLVEHLTEKPELLTTSGQLMLPGGD